MQQLRFEVPQIHCQGCQQTITGALGNVEGIARVDPDITANVVTVDFDEARIGTEEISHRLAQAGFPVQGIAEVASESNDADSASGDGTTALREDSPNRTWLDRRHDGADGDGERGAASRYGLLVASVLAIALAGYTGYVLYPRFDLPAAQGAGLLGLAAAAGIASITDRARGLPDQLLSAVHDALRVRERLVVRTLTDCVAATSVAEHENAIAYDYSMFSRPETAEKSLGKLGG